MPDNIRGNEATVALVLINACAAFAILATYGPDNTRPTVLMVATLMGMGSLYPIFRLLQRPIRYKIVKEKTENKETYVLRYKGYLWWYDGKDKNGNRLTFQNINEAFNFIRSNITTMLINERIRRKQKQKAKKEYETVLDSQSDAPANLQNEMTAAGNAESENKQDITDKEDEKRNESATAQQEMPKDNNASLDLFKKQIASTNQNLSKKEAENQNPTGNDDESEGENEEEEEDEKPLGEVTGDQTPKNPHEQKIHPAEELSRTFNSFDLEKKPKGNTTKTENNTDTPQTNENSQQAMVAPAPTEQTDAHTPLTLTNENPIQRFGPKVVTDVISQFLFHNQKRKEKEDKSKTSGTSDKEKDKTSADKDGNKTDSNRHDDQQNNYGTIVPKNKRRRKSADDGWVGKMKQMTIYDEMQREKKEKDNQPPDTEKPSSGGQKVAKRLEDVTPPKQEKTPANAVEADQPKTDDNQQVFTPGSETKTKEPDNNNMDAPAIPANNNSETTEEMPLESANSNESADNETTDDNSSDNETENDIGERDQDVDIWDTNYSPI